jgi:pantothenate synthetase
MGALHTGHEVLLQQSKHENDFTVLSIFVNPTQFNVQSDFDAYPRNDQRDLQIAEHHGGRIWATSVTGQGATFTFTLPLARRPRTSNAPGD